MPHDHSHHPHQHSQSKRQPDEFYELMVRMADRPAMYFGAPASLLDALQSYLHGYDSAAYFYGGPSLELGPAFSRWLVDSKRLKGGPTVSWAAILKLNFASDEEAYTAFFELFDEYHITVTDAPERGW